MVYYGGYPREVGLLRRQMAEAAFVPPMITSGANSSEEYDLIAGKAAEGTLVVADRRFNTAEFSQSSRRVLRAAYQMIWICASRGVTPASKSGHRRSGPRARQMASPWLKRCVWDVSRLRYRVRFDDEGNVQGPLGEPALWLW